MSDPMPIWPLALVIFTGALIILSPLLRSAWFAYRDWDRKRAEYFTDQRRKIDQLVELNHELRQNHELTIATLRQECDGRVSVAVQKATLKQHGDLVFLRRENEALKRELEELRNFLENES